MMMNRQEFVGCFLPTNYKLVQTTNFIDISNFQLSLVQTKTTLQIMMCHGLETSSVVTDIY